VKSPSSRVRRRLLISTESTSQYPVESAVMGLVKGVLMSMASGEEPISLTSDNIQISVSKKLVTSLSNEVLSPPLTAAQSAYGSIQPKLTLGPNGLSSCVFTGGYAQLSLLQWGNNPYPNSNSIKAPLLRFSTTSTAPTNTNIPTTNILSKEPLSLSGVPVYTISLQFSTIQDFNFSAQESGLRKSNFTLPVCTLFNGVTYVPCRGCNISSYTNTNVTYSCFDITQLCPTTSTVNRYLKSGMDRNAVDYNTKKQLRILQSEALEEISVYGALLENIGAEISDVLSSNPFNLDLSKAVAVLSFMGFLIGFIVILLVIFLRLDYKERLQRTYVLNENRARAKKILEENIGKGGNGDVGAEYAKLIKRLNKEHKKSKYLTKMLSWRKDEMQLKNGKFDINLGEDNTVIQGEKKVENRNDSMSLAVVDFMHEVIPDSNLSSKKKGNLITSILKNHEYLRCFSSTQMSVTRTMRFLGIVTTVLTALFADTLFFGIFYPSDGTCNIYRTEVSQFDYEFITNHDTRLNPIFSLSKYHSKIVSLLYALNDCQSVFSQIVLLYFHQKQYSLLTFFYSPPSSLDLRKFVMLFLLRSLQLRLFALSTKRQKPVLLYHLLKVSYLP
jgi:hypothetical protein